jgi:hypothetical protein
MSASQGNPGSQIQNVDKAATLSDPAEINRLCQQKIVEEEATYAAHEGQDRPNIPTPPPFSSRDAMDALQQNEDGDAWLFVELHRGRFCYDTAAGCWYRWTGHYWEEDLLGDALRSVDAVVEVYAKEMDRLSSEQQEEVTNESGKLH